MLPASPMAALRGGEAVNPSRWQYISVEDCARVIQTEPNLKTRVTVALLRFCGLRGTLQDTAVSATRNGLFSLERQLAFALGRTHGYRMNGVS